MKSAIALALKSANHAAGVDCIYHCEAGRIDLKAVITQVDVDVERGDGITIQVRRTDFTVLSAELVIGGVKRLPLEGDRIEVPGEGVRRRTYEAMPLGTDSHYTPTDAYDTAWRIHTKLVKEE